MRVACVGGGPAGLYFAILMKARDEANEVTVFERNPAGVTYGWGVVFWDDLLDELRATDAEAAHEISANAFQWNGELLAVEGRDPVRVEERGYAIGRRHLLELLLGRARALGVDVRFDCTIERASQSGGADLVVACDGAGSRLREHDRHRFGTRLRVGRNRYIWLGTDKVFDAFTFGFVETTAGWIWCHAYGFDEGASTFIVECAPETWTAVGFDQLGQDQTLRRLEHLFASYLDGHRLRSSRQADGRADWLNFRTVTNEVWHHENVVLMGDAAHTTHFTIGSGTKLALEDAIALAGKLDGGLPLKAALAAYGAERRRALGSAQADARFSAKWFESVPRYIKLDPVRLFALLHERRSPLVPWITPDAYYLLHRATREIPALRQLRRWAAPHIKALYGR